MSDYGDYGWLCESCLFEPCLFHSPDDEEAVRHFYANHVLHFRPLFHIYGNYKALRNTDFGQENARRVSAEFEQFVDRNTLRLKANEMWGWVRSIDLIALSRSGEALRKRKPGVRVFPLCGGPGLVWLSEREALQRKANREAVEARREKAYQVVIQSQREAVRNTLADQPMPKWIADLL